MCTKLQVKKTTKYEITFHKKQENKICCAFTTIPATLMFVAGKCETTPVSAYLNFNFSNNSGPKIMIFFF